MEQLWGGGRGPLDHTWGKCAWQDSALALYLSIGKVDSPPLPGPGSMTTVLIPMKYSRAMGPGRTCLGCRLGRWKETGIGKGLQLGLLQAQVWHSGPRVPSSRAPAAQTCNAHNSIPFS